MALHISDQMRIHESPVPEIDAGKIRFPPIMIPLSCLRIVVVVISPEHHSCLLQLLLLKPIGKMLQNHIRGRVGLSQSIVHSFQIGDPLRIRTLQIRRIIHIRGKPFGQIEPKSIDVILFKPVAVHAIEPVADVGIIMIQMLKYVKCMAWPDEPVGRTIRPIQFDQRRPLVSMIVHHV